MGQYKEASPGRIEFKKILVEHSGLVVKASGSGVEGTGFDSWPGQCVVSLSKTLYLHCFSPPSCNGYL